MGVSLPLPRELLDFLQLPGPQSLLVRGPPGSGKTTLALSLLEAHTGSRYFVTNRVPGEDVRQAFPWMGENGSRAIEVIDNSKSDLGAAQYARFLMNQADMVLTGDDQSRRELREFLWLPEPLQETWALLDPTKPTLVVLDSWDALIESYIGGPNGDSSKEVPSRAQVERALLRRMGNTRAHLVFILEREEQTQLDYLVNGVVVTNRDVVHERLERWLTIYKLRGVRIENASYPFSLESAKFECILPVQPYGHLRGGRFDPAPDKMPNHIWPGSRAFADSFGRLPVGKATMISLERDVPNRIPYIIIGPMVGATVDNGGRVVFLPDASTLPEDVWEAFHGSVPRRRFLDQVRFLLPPETPGQPKSELEHTIVRMKKPVEGAPPDPDPTGLSQFMRAATPETPGLMVIFTQGLYSLASSVGLNLGPDMTERFPAGIRTAIRNAPLHAIVLGTAQSPAFDSMMPIAELRLHIRLRQGRVFMHGSDPWTPSFVLAHAQENTPYTLLRVV